MTWTPHRPLALLIAATGALTACGAAADAPPGAAADATLEDAFDGIVDGTIDLDTAPPPPPPATIDLVTGGSDAGFVDGVAEGARFLGVTALCLAPDGAVYVSDTFNAIVRRVDPVSGSVTTVAGRPGAAAFSDGVGAAARFGSPRGLACLPNGDLLVADSGSLRRVTLPEGAVETIAGFPGTPGDADGDAVSARFGYLVHAMVATRDGRHVVFSDRSRDKLRVVDLDTWGITTLSADGWSGPGGLALDPDDDGRVWVADTFNGRLRGVALDGGAITEVPAERSLGSPQGLVVRDGRATLVSFATQVLEVDLGTGAVRTVANRFGGAFASPVALGDELVYAELDRYAIRALHLETGVTRPIAGPTDPTGDRVGALDFARFGQLTDLAATPSGSAVFVVDGERRRLRRVALADPLADVLAGEVSNVDLVDLDRPSGVVVATGADGDALFVSDAGLGTVWRLALDDAGAPTAATAWVTDLRGPAGLAVAGADLLIAERDGHRVLAASLDAPPGAGEVRVVAGVGAAGQGDGPVAEARLDRPRGVAGSPDGRWVWITEPASRGLRQVDRAAGDVRTLLPRGTPDDGPQDGPVAAARLVAPAGVVYLPNGALWIMDEEAHAIRQLAFEGGEPVGLSTALGALDRAGGLPGGRAFPLEDATLGFVVQAALAGGVVFIASEYAVYRVRTPGGSPWW